MSTNNLQQALAWGISVELQRGLGGTSGYWLGRVTMATIRAGQSAPYLNKIPSWRRQPTRFRTVQSVGELTWLGFLVTPV